MACEFCRGAKKKLNWLNQYLGGFCVRGRKRERNVLGPQREVATRGYGALKTRTGGGHARSVVRGRRIAEGPVAQSSQRRPTPFAGATRL